MTERSPRYVEHVLAPCHAMARRRFFGEMMAVNLAHTLMLTRQGIIGAGAGAAIAGALLARWQQPPAPAYDPVHEDLFFQIEADIAAAIGAEAAGHMHVAFSRNDLDAAIFRMALRADVLQICAGLAQTRAAVLDLAGAHVETVMPAHTHQQQAQPTTLAHYLLGVAGALERDSQRLQAAFARVNRSPMGAAALATTGFPIDREYVADRLGFQGLVNNSYEAVCAHDHMAEVAAALWVLATNLGRFNTDLLAWAANEYGVVRLADPLVQISSIMPQKRNPVALEHVRAYLSRVCGRAGAVMVLPHNVPFGDINDVGDDLQPLLEELVLDTRRVLELLPECLRNLAVDGALLLRRAREGWATSTELADTLVREGGFPFRQAHQVVSQLVAACRARGQTPADVTPALLDAAARAVAGRPAGLPAAAVQAALDPVEFVRRRQVPGGPAPAQVQAQLEAARGALAAHRQHQDELAGHLAAARARLLTDARTLAAPSG